MIDGRTRLFCLLGNPVGHSLSPRMHNRAFAHMKLNMSYVAFKVPHDSLPEAIEGMKALYIRGANVTIPFKEEALKLVDQVNPLAQKVGAINTIVIKNGQSYGYNTDVCGIRFATGKLNPEKDSVLILGAGGVARSAAIAMDLEGFSRIFISNRTESRAEKMAQEIDVNSTLETIPWGEVPDETSLIVNATSLGMETPWPEKLLQKYIKTGQRKPRILDLVYRQNGETPLIDRAIKCGLDGLSGREVLLGQGAEAFELFTEHKAPIEIMREALREEKFI